MHACYWKNQNVAGTFKNVCACSGTVWLKCAVLESINFCMHDLFLLRNMLLENDNHIGNVATISPMQDFRALPYSVH